MSSFILAFPIPVSEKDIFKVTETMQIMPEAKNALIPGSSVIFDVVRKPLMNGLSEIFEEHKTISEEEKQAIDSHQSLLFLLGNIKSANDLSMVNAAILKILSSGATGVYMQQSGTAWTANAFREILEDAEFPMDPWINFIEDKNAIYTLGMQAFSLPDLCVSNTYGTSEDCRDILGVFADAMFVDGESSKSGTEIDIGEFGKFALRQEIKNPYKKDAPEFNTRGIMRLVKV